MKSLRENYNGSAEDKYHMNIMKAVLKYLYFKLQDVFPFENYANRLKES